MSALRKPLSLKPETKIAVLAPSCWVDQETLQLSAQNAADTYGLHITIHDQCDLRHGNSGGTTAQKVQAFHEVWQDPTIGAVFIARGGSRALHLLDGLNWSMIGRYPKILLGYSDTTVLLNSIYRKAAIPSFHGMHFTQLQATQPQDIVPNTLRLLQGAWQEPLFPVDHEYHVLQDGEASAPLIGGNLSLLFAMAASGVDYAPRWYDKILMLEDVDEDLRHLDRMFGALRLAGVFRDIRGLVCGQFTGLKDTSTVAFGREFAEIVAEHVLPETHGPVVLNAPFGHVRENYPFPIGVRAKLQASGSQANLQLTESPFAD